MSQSTDDEYPCQPHCEGITQDFAAKGFHIPDELSIRQETHNHLDTAVCNLVTQSSLTYSVSNHSASHVVDFGLDLKENVVGEHSEKPSAVSSYSINGPTYPASYYDDSEEDRPGSFDYMPTQSSHVRITNSINPQYDEEVKLDSSVGSSTIESPRSDQDEFSSAEKEEAPATKDSYLSHTKHKHPCWDYMPCGNHSEDEDMDDEEDERDRRRGINNNTSSSFMSSVTKPSKQVDDRVSYNLKSYYTPGSGYTNQKFIPNPYSSYLDQSTSEGFKENKKSRSKDDSDKLDVSAGQVDINGNPRLLDTVNYLQMRQWPRSKSSNPAPGTQSGYTSIAIPSSVNSSAGDPNAFDRKKERRRMKLERLKGTPAEAYKGHRKFSDIKEILDFVEGPKSSKSDSKSAKKKQERNKKKDLHNGPLTLDDSIQVDDATSGQEEFRAVTTEVNFAEKAMGNSLLRTVIGNTTTKTWPDEYVDKNNFHGYLNTVPSELVTSEVCISNGENLLRSTNTSGNNIKSITGSQPADSLATCDSSTDKHSSNNKTVTKKSVKTKIKHEKQDHTNDNGPVSPQFSIIRSNNSQTMNDSSVSDSINPGNVKLIDSANKEFHPEIKREDSFTEVKKRKKRLPVKESHTSAKNRFVSSSYYPHINNIHLNHSNQRPAAPSSVSSIATTVSNSTTWPYSSQTQYSRDLSPTAFPILSSQSPPSNFTTETRRNSCGDLNSDFVDSKVDDSDRESAKSLPASHVARKGDLLQTYPVSYARIAAVLPRNDSINSPSSESGISCSTRNSSVNSSVVHNVSGNTDGDMPCAHCNAAATPERKATVWKGSHRERRHSIGSSPEDLVDGEKSSVAERNRQCGSQEVLSRSIVATKDVAVASSSSSSLLRQAHTIENSSNTFSNSELQETTIPNLVESDQLLSSTPSVQHSAKSDSVEQTTAPQSTEYATTNNNSSQMGSTSALSRSGIVPPLSQVLASPEARKNVDNEHNSRITKPCSQISHQSQTLSATDSITTISKTKPPAGSGSRRKNSSLKSVIFMDKRFGSSTPANLGITFGFDSSYETKCEPTNQQQSQQQLSLPKPPTPCTDSCVDTLPPCPTGSLEKAHIPSINNITSALSNPPPSSDSHSKSCDNNKENPVSKDAFIHGQCNGLILQPNPSVKYSLQQHQAANCGTNVHSSIDNPTEITFLQRTCDSVKQTNTSQLNINPPTNSNPLLQLNSNHTTIINPTTLSNYTTNSDPTTNSNPTTISNPLSFNSYKIDVSTADSSTPTKVIQNLKIAPLTDNPCSQTDESNKDTVLDKSGESIAQRASIGVTIASSSNCQSQQTLLSENTDCLTILPSDQDTRDNISASPNECSNFKESILRESNIKPHTLSYIKEAKENCLEAPVPDNVAAEVLSSSTEAELQQPSQSNTQDLSRPVVYGLKIKPKVGCGKLLFGTATMSKKNNKGNLMEISSFLTKRWFEEVIKRKGSDAFVTFNED